MFSNIIFTKDCNKCFKELELKYFINDDVDVCNECSNTTKQKNIINIYVDSGQNKHTNKTSWCCVTDEFGNDIIGKYKYLLEEFRIEQKSLPVGSRYVGIVDFDTTNSMKNNSGELLAMVIGLRIAINKITNNKYDKVVLYSDSNLMVMWWSLNKINSSTRSKMEYIKLKLIEECYNLRCKFETMGGEVLWISGDKNPADLGYHK